MSSKTPASTKGEEAPAVIPASAAQNLAIQSASSSAQEAAEESSSGHAKNGDGPAPKLPDDKPPPTKSTLGKSSSVGASLSDGNGSSEAQPVQEAAGVALPLTQQFIQEWEALEQSWSTTRDDIIEKDDDIQQEYTNEHDDFIKREQEYFQARQYDDDLMKGANASMVSRNYYENMYKQKIADFHIYHKNGATEKQREKLLTPIDINPTAEQISHLGLPGIDDLPFPEVASDEGEAKEKTKPRDSRKRKRTDADDDSNDTRPGKQKKGNDGAKLRRSSRDKRKPTLKAQEGLPTSEESKTGKHKTKTEGDTTAETKAPEPEEPAGEDASEADAGDDGEPEPQGGRNAPKKGTAKKPPAENSKRRAWSTSKPPYLIGCETLVNLSELEFNPTDDPLRRYAILSCHICGGNMSQGTGALLKGTAGMSSHYAGGDKAHNDAYKPHSTQKGVLQYCNKRYISPEEVKRYVNCELDVAMSAAFCNSRSG